MPLDRAEVPTPAIRYMPRPKPGENRLIVGLSVASRTFFEAFVRANHGQPIMGYLADREAFLEMRAHVEELGGDPDLTRGITPHSRRLLAQCGALLVQDPALQAEALRRPDPRSYSLIGITHSLSTRQSWREIASYPMTPMQPWDALVCTTRVARAVVDRLLDASDEAARQAGVPAGLPRPARPVIPLGVDAAGFAPDPARRAAWRARHGVAEGEVVGLFVGRLSLHAKAHPYATFAAMEEAAGRLPAPPRFFLLGQFATRSIDAAFRAMAAEVAPSVRTTFIVNPDDDERRDAMSGADFFVSLADSVQETFGLAPVEAMASGLPVVVTDWDGYKDTVQHAIQGYRVPTLMAAPPAAAGAFRSYLADQIDYDRFCAVMGHLVAVDIRAAANAIHVLASEPERRRSMGEAGIRRVAARYDWPVVMEQWRRLWTELAAVRASAEVAAAPKDAPPPTDPQLPDPLDLFRSFPTRMLLGSDRLHLSRADAAEVTEACRHSNGFRYAFGHLPPKERIDALIERLAREPGLPAAKFMAGLPQARHGEAVRTLLFLAKRDLLRADRAG